MINAYLFLALSLIFLINSRGTGIKMQDSTAYNFNDSISLKYKVSKINNNIVIIILATIFTLTTSPPLISYSITSFHVLTALKITQKTPNTLLNSTRIRSFADFPDSQNNRPTARWIL